MCEEGNRSFTAAASESSPWRQALVWTGLLATLFFLSYGATNNLTAQRHDVQVAMFGWERHIPFIAWSIIPYWSIDLFYVAACFFCTGRQELNRLVGRLLAAQAICITGFVLFPLRFSLERPETNGFIGLLFDLLGAFDKPYNQAPSLHICLLVILWQFYCAKSTSPVVRGLLNLWFCLIGLSVLTTYQHHVIDLITGIWAGCLCLFLVPDTSVRWHLNRWRSDTRRLGIAACYLGSASAVFAAVALTRPVLPVALSIGWLGSSLMLVGGIYLFGEAGHFGKRNATLSWHNRLLLAPYLLGARLNAWLWTRNLPSQTEIIDGVLLGRLPHHLPSRDVAAVVDLCAELSLWNGTTPHHAVPVLDLTIPSAEQLCEAAYVVQTSQRPTLVCCALGFSRSAAAVAAWLVRYKMMEPQQALNVLRRARPQIVLNDRLVEVLADLRTSR